MNAANLTTAAFLDELASGQSTPGGGGAAALTGSQAAALISMVIRFTVGKKKYADVEAEMQGYLVRSEELRRALLAEVDADAAAFDAVSATYTMPKETDEEKAARTAALQAALKHAAAVPYGMAEQALELMQLAEPVGAKGNSNVVSDAASALYLAYASLKCALVNVNINLKFIKDEAFVAAWSAKTADMLARADAAYAAARSAIEGTLAVTLASAQLLDGKALSKTIREELKREFAAFAAAHGIVPGLAVLRVGDDEASAGYARAIDKTCQGVGAAYRAVEMDAAVQQPAVAAELMRLNADSTVHGIMILEPLPPQIDHPALIDLLAPAKDVDGVHPLNAGRLLANRPPFFVPATPAGGLRLLENAGVEFKGKHAVIVGRSDIVGKPMALLLLHRHCTVTITHSRTVDLPGVCRTADILCLAIGRAEMIKADRVKPGAIVVDFGTTYTDDGLKGDCDQTGVAAVAGMLTPVPGGTGPMTNMMLMENLLAAARQAVG